MNEDLIAKLDWDRTIERDDERYEREDAEMQARDEAPLPNPKYCAEIKAFMAGFNTVKL